MIDNCLAENSKADFPPAENSKLEFPLAETPKADFPPAENPPEVPAQVLSNPALLFLYYRVEQILGIKASVDSLIKLNDYIENDCGSSFVKNPAAYEYLLTSREQIFTISKFLTVNETYFFREGEHFELLAEFLPKLAKLNRPINICSAASSIGCEAYSIAMLLDYHCRNGLELDFTIDAFDVNNEAIETAKNARYTSNSLRTDGSSWKYILDSYLIPDDTAEQSEYVVSQNIRRKVRFFPHNIMRGMEKQYDIIFFRNALIYFSNRNRLSIINNLSESLNTDGLLFLGISETSSVKHPLLASRYLSNVFYFQKISSVKPIHAEYKHYEVPSVAFSNTKRQINKPIMPKLPELSVICNEVAAILRDDEGKPNALNVLSALESENTQELTGSSIASCVIYFLHTQDFELADKALSYLEKYNQSHFTKFLRGEYFFLNGLNEDAEKFYHEASVKNKTFWPAFYRIASIASEGNETRYEYKIKKTMESILQSQNKDEQDSQYECFLGGFSPDYFLRILEKKLS